MPAFKCTQCDYIFSDPCPPVTILFGIKVYLEDMLSNLQEQTIPYKTTKEKITEIDNDIQALSLKDEDYHYQQFKTNKIEVLKTGKSYLKKTVEKTFYLECENGNRNNYIISCPA